MNDNPYAPPGNGLPAARPGPRPRWRAPNYLVAFGAASLIAEVLSAWLNMRWDFIMGGFVVLYMLILLTIGVFSAPVRPHRDDLPEPVNASQPIRGEQPRDTEKLPGADS